MKKKMKDANEDEDECENKIVTKSSAQLAF